MRIERLSGKEERAVAIGMIVDKVVLGRIASRWSSDMFQSKWANIVGDLCVQYHKQYETAPGKAVEGLFEAWATKQRDKDTVGLVEKFLTGLSEEYESLEKESNSPHLIDVAARHFNRIRLQRLAEQINGFIDSGQSDKAEKLVEEFRRVEMGTGTGVNVLWDDEALQRAFDERKEPLFRIPGSVGRFIDRAFQREGFICYMGPEKVGKTTWLVWTAWHALRNRKKVAFFAVGDESEEEMMLRFSVLAARHPLQPCTVRIPSSLEREEDGGKVVATHTEKQFDRSLTAKDAKDAFYKVARFELKSKKEYLRLSVHPNSSLTVRAMDAQLAEWERDGFVPDVIVVDYMDILLESTGDSERGKINQTWKDMRGLAQRRHALVVSATQSDAASYEEEVITRKNFSEDKRKLSHVTGMLGINQTAPEKEEGITRLNWVVGRGFRYNSFHCCHCAGAFEVQNPAIKTLF